MKYVTIIFMLICLGITSCGPSQTESLQANFQKVISAQNEGAKAQVSIIDLPFGFKFNMTSNQVDSVLVSSFDKENLSRWSDDKNTYSLKKCTFGGLTFSGILDFGFYEDKLYRLKISSSSYPGDRLDASAYSKIETYLSQNFSSWDKIDFLLSGAAEERTNVWYAWFKDNMEVELAYRFDQVEVTYSNLPISEYLSKEATKKHVEEAQERAAAGPAAKVENSSWDGSVRQVEKYLKNTLKDPKSYESIEWSEVQKDGSNYKVRHKYRAKNSFGGYVVSNQIFVINRQGEVVNVIDL